jgi:hypothetical protein
MLGAGQSETQTKRALDGRVDSLDQLSYRREGTISDARDALVRHEVKKRIRHPIHLLESPTIRQGAHQLHVSEPDFA